MTIRAIAMGSAAAIALLSVMPEPVSAQTSQARVGIEEIVVTARKREERLQDVPITVSVATSQMLESAQVRSGFDLARLIPGLTFETIGTVSNMKPIIRGTSTNSNLPNQQKNSTFIDGVYVSGNVVPPPFFDIARVEVLKGPQSTAFGRATFAGAINYVTKDPTNEWSGNINVSAADDNEYEVGGLIGGPIVADRLLADLSAYYRTYDGNDEWVNSNGQKLGGEKNKYIATKWVATPSDALTFKLRYSFYNVSSDPNAFNFLDASQRTTRIDRPDGTFTLYPVGRVRGSNRPYNQDFSTISDPGADIKKHRVNGQVDWTIADHTLTLVGAYGHDKAFAWESDATNRRCARPPYPLAPGVFASCSKSETEYTDKQAELRLASNGDGALQYIFGAYYLDYEQTSFSFQPNTGSIFFRSSDELVESTSVFGSASYRVNDWIRVGGELRYNIDDIKFQGWGLCSNPTSSNVAGAPCTGVINLGGGRTVTAPIGNPFTGEALTPGEVASRKFKKLLYRFTLDVKPTEDILLYGIVSRGNQPGRFNLGLAAVFDSFKNIDEEVIDNFELGVKSTLTDTLSLNVAGYLMNWKNQIIRRTIVDPATLVLQTASVNAGNSRIYGVEAEAAWAPIEGLDLRGTVAWTHARYRNYCSDVYYQITGIDNSPTGNGRCRLVNGLHIEAQPDWTWSLSAGYARPLGMGDWNWFTRLDLSYQGKKYEGEYNFAFTNGAENLNARFGIENEQIRIEIFGNNLTNDDTPSRVAKLTDGSLPAVQPGSAVTPGRTAIPGLSNQNSVAIVPKKDRQIGIRASYKF